jgi:hypothetical protein
MSGTHILFAHPDYQVLLRNKSTEGRIAVIRQTLRVHACMVLSTALARVPVEKPNIVAAYAAKGMELAWNLDNDDEALRFCTVLAGYSPTAGEREAAELLEACVWAEKHGDVPEFRQVQIGRQQSQIQREKAQSKRKFSPAVERRIAARYWLAKREGNQGAVKLLAGLHDVTPKTIRSIASRHKPE